MKRKIVLSLILLLELFVLIVFGFYNSIGSPEFLHFVYVAGEFFYNHIIGPFRDLCHLDQIHHGGMIACLIINIIFIIIYALIANTIAYFVHKARTKKIRKVVTIPYALNEQEKDSLSKDHFKRKIPWQLTASLIIPAAIIVFMLLARFDAEFSKEVGANILGTSHFYTDFIVRYFQTGRIHNLIVKLFTNGHGIGYMDIINKIPENLYWLEYLIIAFGSIIALGLWFLLFFLLFLPFRSIYAKSKSKSATRKYIYKKELKEYKYRSKHKNEYSSKSEQFMHLVENETQEKQNIAKNTSVNKETPKNNEPSEYFDDLGSSVRDLGVGTSEEIAMDEPFIEREVRYVSDSDFDIVLENEPVIEVAEEEGIDSLSEQVKEDELFYEKYQPEDVKIKPFEEYDENRSKVSEYIKNIDEKDETLDQVVQESKMNEEPQVDTSNMTPLEKYRYEKKKATEERNRLLQEGTLTEENDPLAKYRKPGVRAGKVEAKVPTMAEIEEEKARLHKERSKRIKAGIAKKKSEESNLRPNHGEKKIAPFNKSVSHSEKKVASAIPHGENKIPPRAKEAPKVIPGEKKVPPRSTKIQKKETPGEKKVPPLKVK